MFKTLFARKPRIRMPQTRAQYVAHIIEHHDRRAFEVCEMSLGALWFAHRQMHKYETTNHNHR